MLRYDVQLMFVQLRQQVLRQDQAVDVRGVEFQPRPVAPCSDEPDVELRIVGRQRSPVHEFQKRRQCFLRRGASASMASVMPVRPMISGVSRRPGFTKV